MSTVQLWFQDAGTGSGTLLEQLLQSCVGATKGGGIFAWTNTAGAKSLLEDKTFREFLKTGSFDLIVGLDSITDEAAVKTLIGLDAAIPNLRVRAFLPKPEGLFHPKLAWFESSSTLTLLVGSGNLTMGGLKNNWEAHTVSTLTGADASAASTRLSQWVATWQLNLVPIADPRVLTRAKQNTGNERSLKLAVKPAPAVAQAAEPTLEVLIGEVPRSGGRGSQVNVSRANFERFFGAQVGAQSRVTLYEVGADGTLGEVESRPGGARRSKNYNFELNGMKGVTYPSIGIPIGVYMRLRSGTFLYLVLLPGDAHYSVVSTFLAKHWSGADRLMRNVTTSVATLQSSWPASPLWKAHLPAL
jgi:hypothetical protein